MLREICGEKNASGYIEHLLKRVIMVTAFLNTWRSLREVTVFFHGYIKFYDQYGSFLVSSSTSLLVMILFIFQRFPISLHIGVTSKMKKGSISGQG
ncbi:hypothetical protein CDAR_182311 [Caerostris darwini]|uniref:Uncharacterized protein n=1 Tax=Caerostris darwini TaxID=1538125 RepID=A0AAV4U5F0_9ARAC|nr:hypothetical protein CDAR_182311 [Caerostris darwini]